MCETLNPFVVKSEIVQTAFCHIYYAPDMVSLGDVS